MESDGTTDHDNCMEWCDNYSVCGGFTVFSNRCLFKNKECANSVEAIGNVDIYIKQGILVILKYFSKFLDRSRELVTYSETMLRYEFEIPQKLLQNPKMIGLPGLLSAWQHI